MSRGTTVDVPVTRPIIDTLPAIYRDGEFLRGFTAGLDGVWATVHATLDCLHAYLDPSASPADFVTWLGSWVGAELDEDWGDDRRRRFIACAADLYARRGTAGALADELEIYTGGRVVVADPGSVSTSRRPGDHRVVERERVVRVAIHLDGPTALNEAAVRAVARAAVPAHLPVEVEVIVTERPAASEPADDEGGDVR